MKFPSNNENDDVIDEQANRSATSILSLRDCSEICMHTTKPVSIGRRSSRLKTFAGIDSTSVSVLSGTIPAN
jgi:hypothetical protein